MSSAQKSIKDYAKEAKKRLKTGFWQEQHELLEKKMEKARRDGVAPSRVLEYYNRKIERVIRSGDRQQEDFYQAVRKILDEEGETPDIIGRLTDHSVFDALNYEQRQRYTLDLSERYRDAIERYHREREFEDD